MNASPKWPDERLDELNSAAGLTARITQDTVTRVAVLETTVHTHGQTLDDLPTILQRLEDKLDKRLEARRVSPAAKLTAAVAVFGTVVSAVALVLTSSPS